MSTARPTRLNAEESGVVSSQRSLRVVRHAAPMSFRVLCEQVLPPDARYLLLDLDRTVHLGINTGEMLGWELNAWHSYGPEALDRLEPQRGTARALYDWSQPWASARYTHAGLRRWGLPGLDYLLWVKIGTRLPWLTRLGDRLLSRPPVQHAQRGLQHTLMALLDGEDPALCNALAERIWHRHTARQVITREDLDWVRTRCRAIEIILTSASPRPSVEVAARMLGIETFVCSTRDRINSGEEKIRRLRELRPDLLDEDVRTVGITDTQYGEDHCWAKYLNVVVDINSNWPFPGEVPPGSPLEQVHSARVLTRAERERDETR